MAATNIDLGSEIQSLQDDTKVAEQLLDGLEKRIKSMRKALANLLGGISPASILGEAEKTVKRTTTTVRKETKKAMAAFDEVERIDTADTTTTVTQSVSTTTTGGLAEDSQKLSNTDLTPLLAVFGAMLTVIGSVSLALQTGVLDSLGQIQETVAQIAGEARVPVWLETIGLILGGLADTSSLIDKITTLFSGGGLAKLFANVDLSKVLSVAGIGAGVTMFITGLFDAIKNGLNWLNGMLIPLGSILAGAAIGALFGPLGALVGAGIGFLVGAVTDAIVWLVQNWEKACALFSNAAQWVNDYVIQPVIGFLQAAIRWIVESWGNICAFFNSAVQWINANILQPLIGFFTSAFGQVSEFLKGAFAKDWTEQFGAFGNILNAFFLNVQGMWTGIKGIFTGIISFVKNVFAGNWRGAWDSIVQVFKGIWAYLVAVVKAPINSIIGMINALVGGVVSGINVVIRALNRLKINIPKWVPGLGGQKFGFNITPLSTPKIPLLAQGAVLPANKPFMAVVGDQKHGTNIEAPISLIKQALAEVMAAQGSSDVVINFTGDLAQLGRVLKPVIDRENRRVGGSLVKGVV